MPAQGPAHAAARHRRRPARAAGRARPARQPRPRRPRPTSTRRAPASAPRPHARALGLGCRRPGPDRRLCAVLVVAAPERGARAAAARALRPRHARGPDLLGLEPRGRVARRPPCRLRRLVGRRSRQLWIRPLDSPEARPLPGTGRRSEGPSGPPTARRSRSPRRARAPQARPRGRDRPADLRAPPTGFDAGTWSDEGTIVFGQSADRAARLYSVPDGGWRGEAPHHARRVAEGDAPLAGRSSCPTGATSSSRSAGRGRGAAGLLRDLPRRPPREATDPARGRPLPVRRPGAPSLRPGRHPAGPALRSRELVTMGEAVADRLVRGRLLRSVPGFGWFSASATGRVAWLSGQGTTTSARVGRSDGRAPRNARGAREIRPDRPLPGRRRVVAEVADADGRFDLWLIDVARGVPSRLTTDPANERDPVWSPDGQELVVLVGRERRPEPAPQGAAGSEPAAPLPGGIGQTPGGAGHREGLDPRGEHAALPDDRRPSGRSGPSRWTAEERPSRS